MSDDPNSPGYVPAPSSGGRGAGAGSGSEFGADLHAMYDAGRVRFPEIAQTFSDAATVLFQAKPTFTSFSNRMENPLAMTTLLGLMEDLHVSAYHSSLRCTEAGVALVEIADDYVRVDGEALTEFNGLMRLPENAADYEEPTHDVSPPPHPDAEQPHYGPYGPSSPYGPGI
ncbi:MAG TPA: hypothetical protein VGE77_04930 [Nocardioides sp.]